LRDVRERALVYALIGMLTVGSIVPARNVSRARRAENAHTRRETIGESDVVVYGRPGSSGRFDRCLAFAGYRDPARFVAWLDDRSVALLPRDNEV
jgi:hypothetical protein